MGTLASGYFRAKLAQEELITTQFFEFVGAIVQSGAEGQTVRLPPAMIQPIVSDDVAAALAVVAVTEPVNGTVEIAGPEPNRMDERARRFLSASKDLRQVITDSQATYFGTPVIDQSLTPGDGPRLGPTRFANWLSRSQA